MSKVTLTKAQLRLLTQMAAGGRLFAAFNHSSDYMDRDVLFSESVGIIVHPPGAGDDPKLRYRARNKTAAPLYLAEPGFVDKVFDEAGGLVEYVITDAGRAALAKAQESPSDPQDEDDPTNDVIQYCQKVIEDRT